MSQVKAALVVPLVAQEGKEEQVAAFLAGALPAAQAEAFTPAWFALRASHDVFYIVDAFARLDRCQPIVGGAPMRFPDRDPVELYGQISR